MSACRILSEPLVIVGYRWSTLSPYLFIVIAYESTKGLQNEVPWCFTFADNIALDDVIRGSLNKKLS